MINLKITGLQQAQDALRKELEKLSSRETVLVGVHESAGATEDGQTVAGIAAQNHFGVPDKKIPPRPFLDVGVEEGSQELIDAVEEGVQRGDSSTQVLETVGVLAVGSVKQYITDLKSPPNAPLTVALKGSDDPLIDTGNMRASITHTLTDQPVEEGLE